MPTPIIELSSSDILTAEVDALVVIVPTSAVEKQKPLQLIDAALGGQLLAHLAKIEFKAKAGEIVDLLTMGRIPARRVVMVGLGAARGTRLPELRAAVAAGVRAVIDEESAALLVPDTARGTALREVAEGVGLGSYRFTKYLTGERVPKRTLGRVDVHRIGVRATAFEKRCVEQGRQIADAVAIARDAVNEPPNVLTPEALAARCRSLGRKAKLKVKVLDEKGIDDRGMHLHAAVGRGSAHPPRLIHMSYVPPRSRAKLVFVGKGLTFDSGGLCIKPAPGMGEMKSDMAGAAAVMGMMAAVAAVAPKVEVHGIIGAAENMPDGTAYRPGDIIGSLDGKTVEIINTDAEGRLVLADALAYARELQPDAMIDAATLTGACMVALGKSCSAFYTADERLAKRFAAAAKGAGEQFWRMPLLSDLEGQLDSDVADLKHVGDRWGGSISAALFLRRFVGAATWLHCDVAGPVLADKAAGQYPKGATGHAVLTFLSVVESYG